MFRDLTFSFDRSLSLSIIYVLRKIEENVCCGSLIFPTFLPTHHRTDSAIILAAWCWQKPIAKVEFN